jgi:hypothetical protein
MSAPGSTSLHSRSYAHSENLWIARKRNVSESCSAVQYDVQHGSAQSLVIGRCVHRALDAAAPLKPRISAAWEGLDMQHSAVFTRRPH